jgi:hypothetical protein
LTAPGRTVGALLKTAMRMLTDELTARDRVAIVVYASG